MTVIPVMPAAKRHISASKWRKVRLDRIQHACGLTSLGPRPNTQIHGRLRKVQFIEKGFRHRIVIVLPRVHDPILNLDNLILIAPATPGPPGIPTVTGWALLVLAALLAATGAYAARRSVSSLRQASGPFASTTRGREI